MKQPKNRRKPIILLDITVDNAQYFCILWLILRGIILNRAKREKEMKPLQWMKMQGLTTTSAAKKLGIPQPLLHAHIYEDVIPTRYYMVRWYVGTRGLVTANDFYSLGDHLLIAEPANDNNEPYRGQRYD